MGVTIQGPSIEYISGSIGAWVKANTIAAAETALRAEVARGFDNEPVVVTDGTPKRDYNAVKPFGKIEFIRRPNMSDAVLWALDALRKRSPIGPTRRYVQSHIVLLNNVEITGDLKAALANVSAGDRVQIVNTVPYAKKIEGRKGSKKRGGSIAGQSRQAPRGVYERVVFPLLVRRYGRSMFFDFKFVKLNLGVKVWGKSGGSKYAKRVQRDAVYPALNFFIKQ